MTFHFSSTAPSHSYSAIEKLLFLNPDQHRVRNGIINSLDHFGHPKIGQAATGLAIVVGDTEAQTLFAFDSSRIHGDPAGVVVFLRTSLEEMAIMHVAVDPKYCLRSSHDRLGLAIVLIEKVINISSKIVGVERLVLFYRPV